jgi:hypothetical protein
MKSVPPERESLLILRARWGGDAQRHLVGARGIAGCASADRRRVDLYLALRVSFANCLTLAELVQGIEARLPEVPLRGAFIDEKLSPSARSALAKFLRITEHQIRALEPGRSCPPYRWDGS